MCPGVKARMQMLRLRTKRKKLSQRSSSLRMFFSQSSDSGFTLIEIVAVILIIVILAGFTVSRFDSVNAWKTRAAIRQFVATWEFLTTQALVSDSTYRLVIDLDRNSYYVRKEVRPVSGSTSVEVDYLENLRTKGEKERRREKAEQELLSVDAEYLIEDARVAQGVEGVFYEYVFGDPHAPVREARPTEFPSLADEIVFPDQVRLASVKVRGEEHLDEKAFVRIAPRGGSEFAIIYLLIGDEEEQLTVVNDPAQGTFAVRAGHISSDWSRIIKKREELGL